MKIAIIGANGQLGSDLTAVFSRQHEVVALNHTDIELTDIDQVQSVLTEISAEVVINTAAYHNVPLCEQHPDQAFAVNGKGALHLATACNSMGARLVHYSTDYVFDGKKAMPYVETDYCQPLNVYGTTKLSGENFVLGYAPASYVIRISGIYGKVPCRAKGGNFITTMLKLSKEKPQVSVVNDEILTPTPTAAIAENTLALISSGAFGLYHMTCEGQCSWYEFAKTIWEVLHIGTPLLETSVSNFPATVKRPFYSVLENNHLHTIGMNAMPHWKASLVEHLQKFYC